LQNYRNAQQWESRTVSFGGRQYPIDGLWVITPGAVTQQEFRRGYSGVRMPGYVFWWPDGGEPQFVSAMPGIGMLGTFE
jgi:hypothetical protein